ncbi:hypothetical protein [Sinomicrobium sp. M5D2P17]
MIFFYGIRSTHLQTLSSSHRGLQCRHCKTEGSTFVNVFGRYFHFFWIPLFPVGKTGVAESRHCQYAWRKREFSPQLKTEYKRLKENAKTPVWHFIGLILMVVLIVLPFVVSLVGRAFNA